MLKKLTLVAGFGAGYVLGAKAGKERYAEIEAKFRELAGMPAVQDATTSVKQAATGLADSAKTTVTETAQAVSDKVSEKTAPTAEPVIDLGAPVSPPVSAPVRAPVGATTGTTTGTTTGSTTGSTTGTTRPAPMAGAAPSVTAPDVPRP